MPTRRVKDLTIHPFNREVYGTPDDGLTESLEQFGLEYPVEIDEDGHILSGARRWTAAKKLGWQDIEVRIIETKDAEDLRRHILLANAYRSAKSMFVRQKEADAYQDLLDRGQLTKEDLVGLAKQAGKVPSTPDDLNPKSLAAAAAGMSATTYTQASFVTDPGRGEAEIERAKKEKLISPQHASSLNTRLKAVRRDFRGDRISADRAAGEIRRGIREAKVEHGYTEEERAQRAANEAGMESIRRGRAFINSLYELGHAQHARHLGPRVAFQLAGIVHEAGQVLRNLAGKGNITLPTKPAELAKHAKASE